ncbi:MAG: PKD domain-containing protein [Flavobacteriales bacterium]|nr:PKD domain-containing protein [Flavobacteriales bacterium]
MKKGPETFERSLKDSLESFEVPYNSADWTLLERELGKSNGKGARSTASLILLLFGGALALATTLYILTNTEGQISSGSTVVETSPATPSEGPTRPSMGIPASTKREAPVSDHQLVSAEVAKKEVLTTAVKASGLPDEPKPTASAVVAPAPGNKGEIGIRPSVTEGCPGTTIEFMVDNLPNQGNILWNFGDGSFSKDVTPAHTFSKAGRFEVMLSHSSVGGGTIHNKPVSDVIVIHETPDAAFNFLKQEYDNTIPSVHFENRSMGGRSYLWDFGDGNTTTVPHPSHVYKKQGVYTASVVVTNGAGCTDRIEKVVRIEEDYNLLAAKTFSPNADGVEDSFIPDALKTLGVKFHFTVHDPVTGQLIFESSDVQRPWNGRVGGRGEACAPGDYVWMVEMKDGEKLGGTYNGTVSLLR